jgi:hypothetical protein
MEKIQSEVEYRQIKKDIAVARKIIANATVQYRKRKLGLRNKEEMEHPDTAYTDLDGYGSRDDIAEAYGYGDITDAERDRLWDLWDGRELARTANKRYEDRITDMLDTAYRAVDHTYVDALDEYEEAHKDGDS